MLATLSQPTLPVSHFVNDRHFADFFIWAANTGHETLQADFEVHEGLGEIQFLFHPLRQLPKELIYILRMLLKLHNV
jgi:hypothetical protein